MKNSIPLFAMRVVTFLVSISVPVCAQMNWNGGGGGGGSGDFNTSILGMDVLADGGQGLEGVHGVGDSTTRQSKKVYGIEGLSTWRSEYVHRGFDLASNSMEFQLAGQVTLSETSTLDMGVFYGIATSSGDFSEVAGFIDYRKDLGKYTISTKVTLHEYNKSIFRSGVGLGLGVGYRFNEQFEVYSLISYDTGAQGGYFESKIEYYEQIDEDSYVTLDAGISVTADYYDRSGLNHAFSKLSYVYNVNDSVSVSPYILANLGIHEGAKNHLLGGVYFSVSF